MPTPFNHLRIARDLLPLLPDGLQADLAAEWPAFLFGNIAPDVQTVSGQAREATHFFPVPLGEAPPATTILFARYPALAEADQLPRGQAAFLAGYLAHLEFDQQWLREVFEPVFGPEQTWGTFYERLYLHNALRSYWDFSDLAQLTPETGAALIAAEPRGWLPFVPDADLVRWRNLVAEQLHTGSGAARTVEVFAERLRADPEALALLIRSPDEMERRVFARVSLEAIERYRAETLQRCALLLPAYWAGAFSQPAP